MGLIRGHGSDWYSLNGQVSVAFPRAFLSHNQAPGFIMVPAASGENANEKSTDWREKKKKDRSSFAHSTKGHSPIIYLSISPRTFFYLQKTHALAINSTFSLLHSVYKRVDSTPNVLSFVALTTESRPRHQGLSKGQKTKMSHKQTYESTFLLFYSSFSLFTTTSRPLLNAIDMTRVSLTLPYFYFPELFVECRRRMWCCHSPFV